MCLFFFCTILKEAVRVSIRTHGCSVYACWQLHWQNLDFQAAWKETAIHFPANLPQSISIRVFPRATVVCDKKKKSLSSNATLSSLFSPPSTAQTPKPSIWLDTRLLGFIINKNLLTSVLFDLSRLKFPLRLPVSCNQQLLCVLCIWRLIVKYYHVVTKKSKTVSVTKDDPWCFLGALFKVFQLLCETSGPIVMSCLCCFFSLCIFLTTESFGKCFCFEVHILTVHFSTHRSLILLLLLPWLLNFSRWGVIKMHGMHFTNSHTLTHNDYHDTHALKQRPRSILWATRV